MGLLAEQSGTFILYYETFLLPPPVPYAESVMTRSSEETVVATPTPPSTTFIPAATHVPERRKRTHSVANNEDEEQVKVKLERLSGPDPRPDLHFSRVNGEQEPILEYPSPLPPVSNGVNVHASAAAASIENRDSQHTRSK